MITLRHVVLRRGQHILLQSLDWVIYPKQHIGIIGANGSGKSSLFSLFLGELHPDAGEINILRQIKFAHVAQETPSYTRSAIDFVLDGDKELRDLHHALLEAEQKQDGIGIATLHEKLSIIDAYTAPARAAQLLAGLGFSQEEQQKSVRDFSGGWRVRLNLAKALMCRSEVLLLDEPTNHLDLDAVLWLEEWLMNYPGTLLLISHDRDFLDKTVGHIAHISHKNLKLYTGNYSSFEKLRAAELLVQQASYEKQQKQVAHMHAYVDRFRAKASKARQAQSRLKAIERMDLICAVQTESPFQFVFKLPEQSPHPLIKLEKASVAYGDNTILSQLNLIVAPKDRIAILGPNGAGKSSLIKLLAGEIFPTQGKREASAGLKIGYFAQHQIDQLQLSDTPLAHLCQLAPNSLELDLRKFLGSFGFSGDRVLEPVKHFSGGEKSRLALALLVWQRPNLLLLDEPTNHLDLDMRTALSIALQEYEGAVVLVTHDRFLVRTTTDQLLLAANGKLQDFDGDLNDYQRWLLEFRRQKRQVNMTNFIILDHVSLAFGAEALLDKVKLQISKGERVCLIGRNGVGKSSLLKMVEGTLVPDSGSVWRKPHVRLARLSQELPRNMTETVYEYVSQGLAETGKLLSDYHLLTQRLAKDPTQHELSQLQQLQHKIDAKNGWQFEQHIKTILDRLALNADQRLEEISGGWLRRAALAKALVASPELLLLDEPTNHLDIEAIQWLEDELISSGCSLLFITHDRALLQRLATRIIELDRGELTSWPGDYQHFLRRKDELLHAEVKQHAEFDKKLAQEERWIRQGIKARRTRNEGRVRTLEAMRATRAKRREVQGKAAFNMNEAEQSGQLVIEANNIYHTFDHLPIIRDFSIRIMRGDRIGLIGPNGIGKSTLLNILLGHLVPQQGTVRHGTKLEMAYFDQRRNALEPEKTVRENVAEGCDVIEINGRKQHIMSYLNDFLFTPQRALTPVKALSGGECNRLLLARLFSKPSNLIVMDEPTNDLDIETLELLEELLNQFEGTLLVVSHDRIFLDNVVTSNLVFEGQGKIKEYIGGHQDWLLQFKKFNQMDTLPIKKRAPVTEQIQPRQSKKLNYKEQKELNGLPKKIEDLEKEQKAIQQMVSRPEFYKKNPGEITQTMHKLKKLEEDLEKLYQRWDELETLSQSGQPGV